MPFTLGQRWISDTESELGLGTVVAMDARTVTLLFSSTMKNRLYARSDSPVTRVMFNPGDTITSHEGWQLHVDEVKEENGLLAYIGTRLDTEETGVTLREVLLDSKLVFSKPQDRLFAGQIDRMDRFALRYRARKFQSEQYRMPWSGLRGQRTSLIPTSSDIAHDVGRRHAPRVLLADEVGLGKTIEAGMILHQQLLSGAAERVLIIVPETLQHQWLVEMLRRSTCALRCLMMSVMQKRSTMPTTRLKPNSWLSVRWTLPVAVNSVWSTCVMPSGILLIRR